MKLSETLLQNIKDGKSVDLNMVPGHIATPQMPEEIFDIEYTKDGSEFKRSINSDKWISWIQSVGKANKRKTADISEKTISQSKFYFLCHHSHTSIVKNMQKIGEDLYSGLIWTYGEQAYSISLKNEQVRASLRALKEAVKHPVEPVSNSHYVKPIYCSMMDEEAIENIVNNHV